MAARQPNFEEQLNRGLRFFSAGVALFIAGALTASIGRDNPGAVGSGSAAAVLGGLLAIGSCARRTQIRRQMDRPAEPPGPPAAADAAVVRVVSPPAGRSNQLRTHSAPGALPGGTYLVANPMMMVTVEDGAGVRAGSGSSTQTQDPVTPGLRVPSVGGY